MTVATLWRSEDVELQRQTSRHRPSTTALLLSLSSLAFGLYLGYQGSRLIRSRVHTNQAIPQPLGTFEHGFVTEKILPRHMYEVEQMRFSGSIGFARDGSEFLILDPAETVYVGEPSPAIDQAWDELVEGRYWSISKTEAESLWGAGFDQYRDHIKGGYTGGFDVFHILHCLNMIRKRLNPDYYSLPPYGGSEHDMHCIEQLRQRLQCFASSTITPARYSEALGGMYVDSAQVHTCRKFANLWEYTRQRYNGSLEVPRTQWL